MMLTWLWIATAWAAQNPPIMGCSNDRIKIEINSIGESAVEWADGKARCPYRLSHERKLNIAGSRAVTLVLAYSGECNPKVVTPHLLKGLEIELSDSGLQPSATAFVVVDAAPEKFKKCQVKTGPMKDLLRRVATTHHP